MDKKILKQGIENNLAKIEDLCVKCEHNLIILDKNNKADLNQLRQLTMQLSERLNRVEHMFRKLGDVPESYAERYNVCLDIGDNASTIYAETVQKQSKEFMRQQGYSESYIKKFLEGDNSCHENDEDDK